MTARVRSSMTPYSANEWMRRSTMTDVVTPGWKQLQKSGVLVSNPAHSFKEEYAAKSSFGFLGAFTRPGYPTSYSTLKNLRSPAWRPTSYNWVNGIQDPTLAAYLNTKEVGFGGVSESAISQAHTDISAELAQGIASLLVTFGEGSKTRGMLLKALDNLRHPIRDVLKLKKKLTGKQRVNKVNELWLEGRYGWRPFIFDLKNILDAQITEATSRLTKKGKIPVWESDETILDTTYSWNGLQSKLWRTIKVQGWVGLGQTGDFRAGVMNPLRKFGLYDLVGTGWELIPYSFVVDWFINVGAAAGAMQAYALLDERVGWTTYHRKVTSTLRHEITVSGPVPYGAGTVTMVESYGNTADHYSLVEWNRLARTDFMPVIGARNRLDMLKVIDSAALLKNLWDKFRR
jgi:hypothetical protein